MSKKDSSTYINKQCVKITYLKDIRGRLRDDVGTVLEYLNVHNRQALRHKERIIGFWSSLRMLMPVVEAVAKACGMKPWELLSKHLEVDAPSLAWQMFRHSLTHGDLIGYVKYRSKVIRWGVSMSGVKHEIGNGKIYLDVYTLYDKLVEYLNTEIAKNDQTIIEVAVGVNYIKPKQYILDDLNKL